MMNLSDLADEMKDGQRMTLVELRVFVDEWEATHDDGETDT